MRYKNGNTFLYTPIFILIFVLFHTTLVHASSAISITEIMYDAQDSDTDREWIEIHNNSDSAIDLTKYRYNDGVSSSNHTFVSPPAFPAGAYLLLVDKPTNFVAANPTISSALLVDTVVPSLNNTSGTLSIFDCTTTPCVSIDSVTYNSSQGANGDGKSLQKKSDGTWIAATPTPGTATVASSSNTTDTTVNTGSSGGLPAPDTSITSLPPKIPPPPHMQVQLSVPDNSLTGIEVPISVRVIGLSGENRGYGLFHYSFGDGTDLNTTSAEPVTHLYEFPGTYIVSFQYKENNFVHSSDIGTRTTIDIVDSPVRVSVNQALGVVTISNTGTSEVDISKWNLVATTEAGTSTSFTIPTDTIILPGKTMHLSKKVTQFDFSLNPSISLLLPTGIASSNYENAEITDSSAQVKSSGGVASVVEQYTPSVTEEIPTVVNDTVSQNNLGANALQAVENSPEIAQQKNSIFPYIIALVGIIIGAIVALKTSGTFSGKKSSGNGEDDEDSETKAIADKIRIIDEEDV